MRRLRVLLMAFAFSGCSFLTTFDQDGQPCDKNEPNAALTCLSDAGYWCVNGFCKKGNPPGGGDSGIDAGTKDGGDGG